MGEITLFYMVDGFENKKSKDEQDLKKNEVSFQSEQKLRKKRTPESAVKELQEAYAHWKHIAESVKGSFRVLWLQKNGYNNLYSWMLKNGGIDHYVTLAGNGLAADFVRRIEDRTAETAADELREAHKNWLKSGSTAKFNFQWLREHYNPLIIWMCRREGIKYYATLAGDDVARDFQTRVYTSERTIESAVGELENAYTKWKEMPEDKRGEFNRTWLDENGYHGLQNWVRKHFINTDDLLSLVSPEFQADFKSRGRIEKKFRTQNDAVEELREAHAKWKQIGRGFFNYNWLIKNGYHSFVAWLSNNGGVDFFVNLAGEDIMVDFEHSRIIKTSDSVIIELKEAHEKWKAIPEEARGAFSIVWLQKNGFGSLYQWMLKHGGVQTWIDRIGGGAVADFKTIRADNYSTDRVIKYLQDAHSRWFASSESEKPPFDSNWLKLYGYAKVVAWMSSHGGIAKYIKLSGNQILDDFVHLRISERTEESVQAELYAAYRKWVALDKDKRGYFWPTWLRKNNPGLMTWLDRTKADIALLINQIKNIDSADIKFNVHNFRDQESAVADLRAAHAAWSLLAASERGSFNGAWLRKNFVQLESWLRRNGGISFFANLAGIDIAADFKHRNTTRTSESVVRELLEAHEKWMMIPEDHHTSFSVGWLQKNGFTSLYKWMFKHGGVNTYVERAGGDVASDFVTNYISNRTPEMVENDLRVAHEKWKSLPPDIRGPFSIVWLQKNGFSSLYSWMHEHEGVDTFIERTGGDVVIDFVRRRTDERSDEFIIAELNKAYIKWSALHTHERGIFNVTWLQKNGFANLYYWMKKGKGTKFYIMHAGDKLIRDFTWSKNIERTEESVAAELRTALETWKLMPEGKRENFNVVWLKNHGYATLYSWMYENGGVDRFINFAGGEVVFYFNRKINNKDVLEKYKKIELLVKELVNSDSSDQTGFHSLVRIFGSSHALDLLYKFRPEFKGLPTEHIRSCLADYLGDFLAAKHEFNLKEIGKGVEFLSDITFQDALYENIKGDCLRYYFEQRRKGVQVDGHTIIYNYLIKIIEETHTITNKFLDDVIQRVVLYFDSALRDFHKPEKFVDALAADREFPDINQQINMKEIKDKRRILIADEMGLGKSASVIMAKERLGVGCALVIMPKGVQNTWADYLSDDPARKGYFKFGQAPRVLLVNNLKQLRGITKDQYDYIVISQEKLNGHYAPLLMELDVDMLVVDESHKIKKTSGVRARFLLPLAQKLQGENKYLALLSGTPIPNKVRDVAMVLKLLYPDQFAQMETPELVRSIIHGDLVNLRSLLIPRMQMKELVDVIEMPNREQKIIEIELSAQEKNLYEALVEFDEITAAEKMRILRSFLVNPAILDATPNIACSKLRVLGERLQRAFQTESKVLLIVNDVVTGVMRGEHAVLNHAQLGLPRRVAIEFIHGTDGSQSDANLRPDLQRRFNDGDKPMLLGVSGNAAGVGISLVGGQRIIMYNETFSQSDMNQQKARVYRPGLMHDMVEETLIVNGSIEEGIHEYSGRKHKIIQRVLKGVPISELDKRMLEKAEKQQDGQEADDLNFEENPELARVFLSWKIRLRQMFGFTKGLGEERFVQFLEKWGEDYAEGYRKVGARSYQANTNRVTGTLIADMAQKTGRSATDVKILDVASGPEMLRRHVGTLYQAGVTSMDINAHHFQFGTLGKTYVGSWTVLPFSAHAFDYVNCAMAFQDSAFVPTKGIFERVQVLCEMNRVLKPGGRVVISMIYSLRMKDMEKFKLYVAATGFRLVDDYTGNAVGGNDEEVFASQILTLEKIVDVEKSSEQITKDVGFEHTAGLKFYRTKTQPKKDREILQAFMFEGGKGFPIMLNDSDRAVLREEREIKKEAEDLRVKYKTIKDIPSAEVITHGFIRIRLSAGYHLFKQLKTAPGVIFVK